MTALPLPAYVPVAFVLVITPGATTAVVVRNALEGGWRGGAATAAGAAIANSTHAAAAGLGLAVLLQRSPHAFAVMRVAGALYLAWLALGSLRRALAGGASLVDRIETRSAAAAGRVERSSIRQGLMVNLLNPAIATFYLVIVPPFLPPGSGLAEFAVLAAIHISMAFACHLAWALAFDRLRALVTRPAPMRALEAAAGGTLLLLAARTMWRG